MMYKPAWGKRGGGEEMREMTTVEDKSKKPPSFLFLVA